MESATQQSGPREPKKMRTLAVIAVRDEESYLPGYFYHLRDFVDGFAVVDDGSLDKTAFLIKQEPKLKFSFRRDVRETDHFFEVENREILLRAAKELKAEWVLCCDADERYESSFLKELTSIQDHAEEIKKPVVGLRVLGLWNSAYTYRIDGSYGKLTKFVMFKVPNEISYTDRPHGSLHSPWLPSALRDAQFHWSTDWRIYHLRMIRPEDRKIRFEKFRRIDPENKWQSIGYSHLLDETGLELKEIERGREFNMRSLPNEIL
ncbi:hypothetical protein COY65_01430 [Candidatus Jorgensenbacteria bacterium CG_4_10_14_0_8_um_filter_39_13]|uniref:Glycosyltransferase 2-like domain-containing protein n=2 Tax=Candidatus Joergenseniibacteriota TaxID=1752739 RepID=A0A2M7RHF4_9BACT|nr:MAG: hypothetical protein COV54_00825 [Candidatus Jorgensenbacteria bacterium CG11_big_fil_rev_8_21_14_0_20_38_23]PIY96144.1 MAG: hypothetical protein COY65_01430 [Candidatus Jorgensenbacteria bacterium CG_4_10_14_0_8_um_filter_39_13]PJA95226.1 MAG: hypothetical protein CO130_00300 [Candidatus Jorgensenbacteria bacterium CG_4_9_14_3_um_filter_38_10]